MLTMRSYVREHASNILVQCSTIPLSGRILENGISMLLEAINCKNITTDTVLQIR
jgi:hypothetical protein